MAKFDYNIFVIGGGSAGLSAAYLANALGAKVGLAEKKRMGGDCLHTGCVPSKALLHEAAIIAAARSRNLFKETDPNVVFLDALRRVKQTISNLEPHDSVERYRGLGVDCYSKEAKIVGPHEISVEGKIIRSRRIILALGARPNIPMVPGIQSAPTFTSDTIWDLKELPKKLLVFGGGAIGSELAQAFSRLGAGVTQVERHDRVVPREDREVGELLGNEFKKSGINVLGNTQLIGFEKKLGKDFAVLKNEQGEFLEEFSHALFALGRKPNTDKGALDSYPLQLEKNGALKVNAYLQTSAKSIYACGDCVGPFQFTHMAGYQAQYAVLNAIFRPWKGFKIPYSAVPWVTFTSPEIARVGWNEQELQEKKIPYQKITVSLQENDRAVMEGERGFLNVLLRPGSGKVLGVTAVGENAGEWFVEWPFLIRNNLKMKHVLNTIHAYPTVGEINRRAAAKWRGESTPEWIKNILKSLQNWQRR